MQKSFKGAWGQISPTSEKWLQATLLAKCEVGRVRRLASSKVGTALPCLPVRFRFCKGTLFLIEGAPSRIRSRTEPRDFIQYEDGKTDKTGRHSMCLPYFQVVLLLCLSALPSKGSGSYKHSNADKHECKPESCIAIAASLRHHTGRFVTGGRHSLRRHNRKREFLQRRICLHKVDCGSIVIGNYADVHSILLVVYSDRRKRIPPPLQQ